MFYAQRVTEYEGPVTPPDWPAYYLPGEHPAGRLSYIELTGAGSAHRPRRGRRPPSTRANPPTIHRPPTASPPLVHLTP